jgi:hypothetical protein
VATPTLTWQLVRGKSWTSTVIGWFGDGYYSHIDVITPQGMLRGARSDVIKGIPAGYQDRPQHYETWARCTRFHAPVTPRQYQRYWDFSDSKLGASYDERGLLAAFLFGRKHTLKDPRDKWVGWCSQEVALDGAYAGLWRLPPDLFNVTPGDCAFMFAGKGAIEQEMPV